MACGSDASPSNPSTPSASQSGSTAGSSGGATSTPAPSGTTTPAPAPTTPPEPPWVAPVVATSSAACNGAALPQALGTRYTTPSGRTYHVWGPSNYDPSKTYPVVMTFHGWYADGAAFESWFKMEDYTNNEAFVVYPDAIAGLWDLSGDTDLLFFDEMVKQLGETFCIDPSHILGFGFSYGAKFMNNLGCKRTGYVKAIMMGDGSDGGDYLHCGRLPVLVTVRTADTNELPAWGKADSEKWSTLDRCTGTAPGDATMNCTSHTGCQTPGDVTFCEDTFFDPTWPVDWNHTVREPYRAFAWQWFKALP